MIRRALLSKIIIPYIALQLSGCAKVGLQTYGWLEVNASTPIGMAVGEAAVKAHEKLCQMQDESERRMASVEMQNTELEMHARHECGDVHSHRFGN